MKKVLIALAALALLLTGSAYYTGARVESLLQDGMARMAKDAPNLACTLKEKHRGLFESSFVYSLSLAMPPQPGGGSDPTVVAVVVNCRVAHGPIPFAAGSFVPCLALADATFALAPDTSALVRDIAEKVPELLQSSIRTRFNFDSSTKTTVTVPPFSRDFHQAEGGPLHVDWQGLTADIDMDKDITACSASVEAPGMALKDEKAQVVLSGFSGTSASGLIAGTERLWSGKQRYALKSLEVKPSAPGKAFAAADLVLDAAITPNGPVLDYTAEMSGTGRFAGGSTLPMRLGLAVRSLDMAALEDLQATLRKPHPDAQAGPLSPEDLRRVAGAMLPRAPRLEMTVAAMAGTQGPVSLKAEVKTEAMREIPDTLPQALSQLRAKAWLDAPEKSLADLACLVRKESGDPTPDENCRRETPVQINALVSQGQLVRKDGRLVAEAVWDGQGLFLNGKPMR